MIVLMTMMLRVFVSPRLEQQARRHEHCLGVFEPNPDGFRRS